MFALLSVEIPFFVRLTFDYCCKFGTKDADYRLFISFNGIVRSSRWLDCIFVVELTT